MTFHPAALAVTNVQVEMTLPAMKDIDCGSAKYSPGRLSRGSVEARVALGGAAVVLLKNRSTTRVVTKNPTPAACVLTSTVDFPVTVPGAPDWPGSRTWTA